MNVFLISDLEIYGHGGGSIGDRTRYQIVQQWCESKNANLFSFSFDKEISTSYKHITLKKSNFFDVTSRLFIHSSYVYFNKKIIRIAFK